MNIGLYGKSFTDDFGESIQQLISKLEKANCCIYVFEPFHNFINKKLNFNKKVVTFKDHSEIRNKLDYLISIGGDGTLLSTISLIRDSNIPVVGINTGRLGFLASISKNDISNAIDDILDNRIILEKRSLLKLEYKNNLFGDMNYALNEITVKKKDTSSMITINVYVNDEFLNSYWADGLIIATPTGSTAYSLSCGGPIITPESENFIITPIASHNLTVRPIVIPDRYSLKLNVSDERNKKFLVNLDSRSQIIDNLTELKISKADFKFNMVRLENEMFFSTIRNKLMWGLDKRN
ncbi:MAG: NAD kinase [Bacteroidetes bacterium]|nr:NAD kinase [Bacteroidota bacterium]